MEAFVHFLLQKVYNSKRIEKKYIDSALSKTILDVQYHHQQLSDKDVVERIITNNNELAVFLFRLGNELHQKGADDLKSQIHWLLKELCGCEIYFNNEIGEGFYVVHGEGTVIGSRNKIGKGFKIHQGCTIGHKKNGSGSGNTIGNNVTLYANSSIIGEVTIGDNVIIGAHMLITNNIPKDVVVTINK
ncbi:serine acetyltransferase [Flavobacterium suncheonense]|uniref:serine acetyltransferase n=1 Tax=Flavobacterium suncheonense TaxID=350894 RepID=UPI0004298A28|nr:serine acetyltransferase [Flavobacterium suncheonense]